MGALKAPRDRGLNMKFGSSLEAVRAHLKVLFKYFLDISWMTDLKTAKVHSTRFPPELKVEPNWQ